jgi:hypothetical protein
MGEHENHPVLLGTTEMDNQKMYNFITEQDKIFHLFTS